jgi:8-oxo-dGTP diphosphatase
MNNPIQTVTILAFNLDRSKVLIVNHKEKAEHISNTYGLPSGRIEPKESKIECAVRELREETGLLTASEELIELPFKYKANIKRKDGTTKLFEMSVFYCKSYQGEISEQSENIPEWVDIKKLDKLNLLPNVEKCVLEGLDYTSRY